MPITDQLRFIYYEKTKTSIRPVGMPGRKEEPRIKYRSRKTEADGIVFDSKKEAARYRELQLLQKTGQITGLRLQEKYELIPAQREPDIAGKRGGIRKGKLLEHACCYVADFVYEEDGKTVVEDTKGFRTKDYIIKRKLMLYVRGIRIREI